MKKYILLIILFLGLTSALTALDFSEDWESGDFVTNGWTFEDEAGNWEVWEYFGNPGSSARFAGFPNLHNYDHRLVSPIFDGTDTESITLSFDLFGRIMMPGMEMLSVEVRNFGGDWQTIATYDTSTPGDDFTWISEQHDISGLTVGTTFQIAFRAHGTDTMNLIRWHIDNICVSEPQPVELPFLETWNSGDFSTSGWKFDPEQGTWNITQYNSDNVAEFLFDMITDYSYALTSPIMNGVNCPTVELNYDIALYNFEFTGQEFMSVEVSSGDQWMEIASYDNAGDGFQISETIDISEQAAGSEFEIRFRAHGADAFNIDAWTIDNIIITDGTPMAPPRLSGHVIDAHTQQAITDAAVYICDLVQITYDEDGLEGEYGFDFSELESGTQLISCSAPGYSTYSETINLQMGEELEYVIMLQPNPLDQVPQGLQAQPAGLDEVEVSWNPLQIDEYLAEAYDDGNEELMAGYNSDNNQLIGNRFEFSTQIDLYNACFYLEFGNTDPFGENPQVKFHLLNEINGQPDINNPLCETIVLDNLIHNNPVPAFWLHIPNNLTIPAQTPFYLCMEWEQNNPASEFMSIGIDLSNPQGFSWMSMDAGETWMQMVGEMAMNAMIRCHYLPQEATDQILLGYNLYRNGSMLNTETLTAATYNDSGLAQGDYSYQVSAVYNDNESELSEPVTITAGMLPAPHFINATLYLWEGAYVSINWNCQSFPGLNLLGYNLYKDGEQFNEELLPLMPRYYHDYEIANGEFHSYQVTAVYEEGESDFSALAEINVLMPPQNCYGIPWADYVELGWEPPVQPIAGVEVLGYNIYNFGEPLNSEIITDTFYEDTEYLEQNDYFITVVYSTGESVMYNSVSVETGEEVILPPQYISALEEDGEVELFWQRPDDGVTWHGWDEMGFGASWGMEDNSQFTALVEFDEWDLLEFENNTALEIAFFPTAEADYTVQIYSNDFMNPQNYVLNQEIAVEEYTLNDWNIVSIYDIPIMQTFTRIRIGIVCSGYTQAPLACDQGPNETDKADYVIIDDQWYNLSQDFELDANWKIRLMLEEQEGGGPVRERNSAYILESYKLYRNDEEIIQLNNLWEFFIDQDLEPGDYTYALTCVYNVMNAVLMESEPCEPVTITIEEPSFPAPTGFEISITDYNTAQLSWTEPGPQTNYTAADTTHNLRGTDEMILVRERELLGFDIYRDSELVNMEPVLETCYNDSLLAAGEYLYQIVAVYDQGMSEPTPGQSADIVFPAPIEVFAEYIAGSVIITWDTTHPQWTLDSFNLYRNDEMITDQITAIEYTDIDLPAGEYTYQVQAVYLGGYTSELSEPFVLEVTPNNNDLLPQVTQLKGNYPNPFNPQTCIRFDLAAEESVSLKVYNIKGELVRTLVNEKLPAGCHQITWQGKDNSGSQSASGIYLYKIDAGNYHALRKMSLLK